jgi:hypothetical protein
MAKSVLPGPSNCFPISDYENMAFIMDAIRGSSRPADLHEQLLVDSGGNTFAVYNDEVG